MSFDQRSLDNELEVISNGFENFMLDVSSNLSLKNNGSLELIFNQEKMNEEKIIKTEDGVVVRKVFVTNIDKTVIKRELLLLFANFGRVHDVFIKTCDRSVGTRINVTFGFVTFIDPRSAYDAIKSERPIILKHRRLKVRPADTWHQPVVLENGEVNFDVGVNAIESSLPLRKESYNGTIKKYNYDATTSKKLSDNNKTNYSGSVGNSCNINILNDDCFIQLFSYFTLFELIELEEVCSRWHNIINIIWERIHHLCTDDLYKQCKSQTKLTTDALRRILVRCGKHLKSLKISSDRHTFNSRIHQVISKSCPYLQTLHLSGIFSNATGVMALSRGCKELKTLIFKDISGVQDQVLEILFKQNPNLECIHIEGSSAMTGKCLRTLPCSLREIALINCNSLQLKELRVAFRNMKNLQSLTFESCVTLTSNFLIDVAECFPDLDTFSLKDYYPLMHINSLKPIVKMSNLRALSFSMNSLVSNSLLEELSQKCLNLESFDLSSCNANDRSFTIEGLNYLAKFPKLCKVYLNYMEIVTEESLSPLALQGNLVHLELRGCPNLTDDALQKVVDKCEKLQCLDISGCEMVSIDILTHIFNIIKARNNSQRLKFIIGGSGIIEDLMQESDSENLKDRIAHPNFDISYENLCQSHLRPDFFDDYFPDSDDDLDMLDMYDDDVFDDDDFYLFDPQNDFHYFAAGALFDDVIDFLSDDDYY